MVAEDLKFKQINSIQTTSTTSTSSRNNKEVGKTIENIFKAFQKFAAQRGVTLNTETFQAVVNAHPEIFELPVEKQADAIIKFIAAENETSNLVTTEENTETPQASTTPFSFAALSEEEQIQLSNTIKETIAAQNKETQANVSVSKTVAHKTPSTEPLSSQTAHSIGEKIGTGVKQTADERLKHEINTTIEQETKPRIEKQESSVVSAAITKPEDFNKKELYNEYLNQYAQNLYLFGQEKHTEEDWNKLSESEKEQFIKNNDIKKLAKESLNEVDSAFGFMGINKSISKDNSEETILRAKLLALQASKEKGITYKEFKNLSKMEQGVAMIDIIAAKDSNNLTPLEKLALEEAKILKDAVIYKFQSTQDSTDNSNIELIEKMSYGELYGTLQKANKTDCLAMYLRGYLKQKDPNTFTEYEKNTYEIIKDLPVFLISNFGTAPGVSALESEIINNEEYKNQYLNAQNPRRQARIKADYFYKQYGDNPEKFMATFQDAIKHGNLIEVNALMSLIEKNKLPETKAYLEKNKNKDNNILAFSNAGINTLLKKLNNNETSKKLSPTEIHNEARILVNQNPEELDTVAASLHQFKDDIATGIIEGTQDLGRAGKLLGKTAADVGAAAAKCSEKVQDAGIELAGDKAIDSKVRAQFATPLFQNSGYAAQKGIDKEVTLTFNDNSEAQQEVFCSLKYGVETHCPKKNAVTSLQKLNTQLSKLNEDIQAEMAKVMLDSKYEEVAVHTATIIHTLSKNAQAEALQAAYNTGNIEIIEAATLQVDKMAKPAVEQMKEEIKKQIIAMEDRHAFSAIEELALRQLKKMLGFGTDTTSSEFKTRLEAYIAELKSLPRSEVYLKICNDIQSWPSDKQALVLEAIAKYCPILFSMMLDKYGTKLLSSFGQLNSTTKNTILSQMLKTPSQRSDAIAYIQANPNGNYSDNLKQLYNEILDELVKSGTVTEESVSTDSLRKPNYQSIPADFSTQNSIVTIGQKYNWNMSSDVDGNLGLIS